MTEEAHLAVAELVGQAHHLGRRHQPVLHVLRPPFGEAPAREAHEPYVRVADSLGHRHRTRAEGSDEPPSLRRVGPVERNGQAPEHQGAECVVLVRELVERLLEESDERLVDQPGRLAPEPLQPGTQAEGGGGEALGQGVAAGDLRGLQERPPRLVALASTHPGATEREQQIAARPRVGHLLQVEHLERALVVPGGFLVGEELRRAGPRAAGIVDRLPHVAALGGLDEVVGQLRQVRLRVRPVEALQHLRHLAVEPHSTGGLELVVERLPDEPVREGVSARAARQLEDDAGGHRLVEHLQHPVLRETAHARERIEPELAPEHRGNGQHPVALRREAIEAPPDHLAHALRNADAPRGHAVGVLQPPIADEQPHDLVHEEGIALGLAVDRLHERRGWLQTGRHLDEALDVLLDEAAEEDALAQLLTRELAECLGEGMLPPELHVAVRADHQEPGAAQLPGDELKQQERGLVGPVQVVEQKSQRLFFGDRGDQLAER